MAVGGDPVGADGAPGDDGASVVVFVVHGAVRELIVELLHREHGSWTIRPVADASELTEVVARDRPDVVVVDAGNFAELRRRSLRAFPPSRVVVISPEPDRAYERAAAHSGAGAWLPRERIADDLSARLQAVLDGAGPWKSRKPIG